MSSGGLGPRGQLCVARCHRSPGADPVVAALSALPTAVTRRAMATVPGLVSGPDAGQIADVLSGLRDSSNAPRSFVPPAPSSIGAGQAVSAQRQTGLLHGVPVLVAWGAADTTIPPDHHRAFANRVPGSRDGRDRRDRTLPA